MDEKKILLESQQIKKIADKFLSDLKLVKILSNYGEVRFTGSYAADLMMTEDIDIYVVNKNFNKKKILEIFNEIVSSTNLQSYKILNTKTFPIKGLPDAFYIGLKVPVRKSRWEIDIWFLTEKDFKKTLYHDWSRINISREQKIVILKLKKYRDSLEKYFPSLIIYEAVFKENVLTLDGFKRYLKRARNK